ncbi:MAG: type I-D CRISPR-associated protein Cas7/Csc2 [Candidatus Bathyarchaeia archaeon]|nr:type I-D CRISPR-associated protein Cas7/Csc2 [Candidatus Bathyarchaeia archaeon]
MNITKNRFRPLDDELIFEKGKLKNLNPIFKGRVFTVVGIRRTTSRFMPVSHLGFSNESYVDKDTVLGEKRAVFIGRKQKAIERRMHMKILRREFENLYGKSWKDIWKENFTMECEIPNNLCVVCPNCSLFGALRAGEHAWYSKSRYFDTYSIEPASTCIASKESDEGMGLGNQVYESPEEARGAETFFYYEYVKPNTHFPFITMILEPTELDVSGYLIAHSLANKQGFGQYSAVQGKFDSKILGVALGYPKFSVVDMLNWVKEGKEEGKDCYTGIAERLTADVFLCEEENSVFLGENVNTFVGERSTFEKFRSLLTKYKSFLEEKKKE